MKFRPVEAAARRLISLGSLALALLSSASAQQNGAGPCALVIGYKAAPQDRPALRAYLQTKGVAQFERWQHDGVFASYQIFFSTLANKASNDLTVILQFNHFADVARWSQVERKAAGGLATPDRAAAIPVESDLADRYHVEGGSGRDPATKVCMLIPYTVTTDMGNYRKYVDGYVVPQMDAWVKRGVMSDYAIYLNQNGAGSAWDSLLVLEYNGYEGLAQREILKAKVREDLASNSSWKEWSSNKTHIRNEGKATIVEPIVAP